MFHGSSMAVSAPLFCKSCLARGHQCAARDGSDECIFCEDNTPYPIMRRQATEPQRISSSTPILRNDALLSPRALEKKRARPATAANVLNEEEAVTMAGSKHQKHNPDRRCSCGCGGQLLGRWPYLKGHGGKHAGGGQSKPKLQRKAATPAARSNSNGSSNGAHLSLVVSEQQLDDMFLNWPVEDKLECVQRFLGRPPRQRERRIAVAHWNSPRG